MREYLTLPRGSMPHSYMDGRVRKVLVAGAPIAADHPEAEKLGGRLVPYMGDVPGEAPAEVPAKVTVQPPEPAAKVPAYTKDEDGRPTVNLIVASADDVTRIPETPEFYGFGRDDAEDDEDPRNETLVDPEREGE